MTVWGIFFIDKKIIN